VKFEAAVNFNRQLSPNYPAPGYGSNSPIYELTVWGAADFDVRDLRNYWQPGKVV